MLLYPILCFGPMVMAVVCYVLGRASKSKRDLLMMATVTAVFAGTLATNFFHGSFTWESFCGCLLYTSPSPRD